MRMYRRETGLIVNDQFDILDSRWNISGQANATENPGYLRLMPSAGDTLALFNLPVQDIALEFWADFVPVESVDRAGLIVWKDSETKIELLETLLTSGKSYDKYRAVRMGLVWDFYGVTGDTVEYIDSAELEAGKAGVILKSGSTIPFDVDRMVLCKGDKLYITNVLPGWNVELYDDSNSLVSSKLVEQSTTYVLFEIPRLALSGRIDVKDETNTLIGSIDSEFYGGDVYEYGTYLIVEQNGAELAPDTETDIGYMQNGKLEVQMTLKNPSNVMTAQNIELMVQQYDSKFGYQWADISSDVGGVPGTYSDTLAITSLVPGGEQMFWLKVEKGAPQYTGLEPLQFEIFIDHE
ncbi:hypothetical protein LC040_12080 [Bacillus tianshenii]|nr:hypothetical protein LC040_12080 [Bacillus tianshenii]